jgi:hypothetical protein
MKRRAGAGPKDVQSDSREIGNVRILAKVLDLCVVRRCARLRVEHML